MFRGVHIVLRYIYNGWKKNWTKIHQIVGAVVSCRKFDSRTARSLYTSLLGEYPRTYGKCGDSNRSVWSRTVRVLGNRTLPRRIFVFLGARVNLGVSISAGLCCTAGIVERRRGMGCSRSRLISALWHEIPGRTPSPHLLTLHLGCCEKLPAFLTKLTATPLQTLPDRNERWSVFHPRLQAIETGCCPDRIGSDYAPEQLCRHRFQNTIHLQRRG